MKKIFVIFLVCFLFFSHITYASTDSIICNASVEGRNVSISGQLPGSTSTNQITLLVGSAEDIVYINQFPSNADGSFNYNFSVADNVAYGTYEYKVGNDAEFPVYTGVINIEPDLTVEELFLDADMRVSIDGYVPKIEGTLSCMEGKTVNFNITNTTDNTVIANDTITVDDNVYNMSYTLPSLLSTKDYSVTVSCKYGTKTLAVMNINIDTALLVVTISGTVETADNVSISAHLQTENSELLDKNTLFAGSEQISVTIPNLVSGASFLFNLEGYRTVEMNPIYSSHTVTGSEGKEVLIIVSASNISNFNEKIFTIEFDESKLEAVDLTAQSKDCLISSGIDRNVEILSFNQGIIKFKINNLNVESGKTWNGVLNMIKFRFKPGYSGATTINVR